MRVKFLKVSLVQILSRVFTLQQRAHELQSVFSIPCKPTLFIIVSRLVAAQYRIRYSNLIQCVDGTIYGSEVLDVGSSTDVVEVARYILCNGFEIRGSDAYRLRYILRRSSGVLVEEHGDRVVIMYAP
ncbi:MAG TPA: hypothetical protein EYH02_01690 [Ignisphaera aggregans]|uniref:Uncharacterized protein n=1 Tax=Ignisphaera aggregans TaxID=334771 RepID=A0A832YYA2_9CREN|nr:hypothetical protein [Ignisphaera aggregans]